uniref:Putative resolvase domain containing protein n=1 Tax=viral metagenome TaxID=1070528 RepID=A0A6M3X7X8_9ZZZZ
MKLSDYAKKIGVNYRTAWNWYKSGILDAVQMPTGTIIVKENENQIVDYVVIYARVSSSENKNNLDTQAERLVGYATAKGYQIKEVVKEIGSGVNDNRQRLQKILREGKATIIVVEHKDRLTRFGFNYLSTLLEKQGCHIEIVNETGNDKDDLMQDLVSIITSMCARYYGLRRSKRKTEKIIQELKTDDKET